MELGKEAKYWLVAYWPLTNGWGWIRSAERCTLLARDVMQKLQVYFRKGKCPGRPKQAFHESDNSYLDIMTIITSLFKKIVSPSRQGALKANLKMNESLFIYYYYFLNSNVGKWIRTSKKKVSKIILNFIFNKILYFLRKIDKTGPTKIY